MSNNMFREALEILAADNNMALRPVLEWPGFFDYNWLENEIQRLASKEELETFICGEVEEMEALCEKYYLHTLNKLLNMIFDGDLCTYFFYD